MKIDNLRPDPVGSYTALSMEEEGQTIVEINCLSLEGEPLRARFELSPAIRLRVNDQEDVLDHDMLAGFIEPSQWLMQNRSEYLEKFGATFASTLDDLRHFVVVGQDMSVGAICRDVRLDVRRRNSAHGT